MSRRRTASSSPTAGRTSEPLPDFVVTISRRLPGARLSRPGHWGNRPFASVEDAETEARRIGGDSIVIIRELSR